MPQIDDVEEVEESPPGEVPVSIDMGILARKSVAEPEQAGDLEESFFETKPNDDIMGEISFNMLTKNTAFQKETAASPSPDPWPEV